MCIRDSLICVTIAAYYTQGGKTSHQIEMCCLEALQSPVRNGFIGLGGSGIGFAVHRKMYMAVAQAGGDKLTGEINDLIAIKFCFRSGQNGFNSVSYTHLDVYKRQPRPSSALTGTCMSHG